MTSKGHGVIRGRRDLLYDPKGQLDRCGRFDLVYDPKRSRIQRPWFQHNFFIKQRELFFVKIFFAK